MKPRILVVGSANMDMVLSMPYMPQEGESIVSNDYTYIPGGKGANAAVSAARVGADVIFCARLGNDENGKRLIEAYRNEGIITRYIKIDKAAPTGLAVILLDERNGKNRIVVYPSANLNLEVDDVENAFLSYPDAVLIQFETSAEAIIAATEFAAQQQIPVFIDAGPVRKEFTPEVYQSLQNVEIVSPNEVEIAQITGIIPTNPETCLQACMKLSHMIKTKNIVIKLSDRGCFMYDGKYYEMLTANYVEAVDTTAAGDAFTAALAIEYLKTKNLSHSCKYANVAGALTVTKFGAMSSLPTQKQIDNFIDVRNLKI